MLLRLLPVQARAGRTAPGPTCGDETGRESRRKERAKEPPSFLVSVVCMNRCSTELCEG